MEGVPTPAVLDAGPFETDDELPSVLYIPSEHVSEGALEDTNVELRRLEDGRLALLVFSSLEQLVAGCGNHQPWVGVPGEQLEELRRAVEADIAVLDTSLPTAIRHGSGGIDG